MATRIKYFEQWKEMRGRGGERGREKRKGRGRREERGRRKEGSTFV